LGFGYLSPLSPRKKSKRKKNHSALPAPMWARRPRRGSSSEDDKKCNKIRSKRFSRQFLHLSTTIKFSIRHSLLQKKVYTKTHTELYATDCKYVNQTLHGRSVACLGFQICIFSEPFSA
jgi:hypothetical protein